MKRPSITPPVLLACTVLVSLPALANFSDNFQSGDNAWTHYSPLTPFGSPATFSFPNLGYQISVPQSLAPTQLGDGRGGSFVSGQTYSDFSLSFDIFGGGSSPQFTGAFTRVNTPGLGTLSGYAVGFDYATDQLIINKVANEASAGPIGTTAVSPVVVLNSTDGYTITYTALGAFQQATLTDKTTGQVVTSVYGTDGSYIGGQIGLGVLLESTTPGLTASATFGNFSVTTVPEPSTWALATVGLGAVVWTSRRQRR